MALNLDPQYTIKDVLESQKDGMFEGSTIVLNGSNWVDYKPLKGVSWVTSDTDSYLRWAVDQVEIVDGRNSIEYTGSTCFRIDSPYLLVLSESHREPLEQLYNQYICKTNDPCSSFISIKSIPKLVFKFPYNSVHHNSDSGSRRRETVSFSPEEFIYEEDGIWKYAFSSENYQYQIEEYCNRVDDFIVG